MFATNCQAYQMNRAWRIAADYRYSDKERAACLRAVMTCKITNWER